MLFSVDSIPLTGGRWKSSAKESGRLEFASLANGESYMWQDLRKQSMCCILSKRSLEGHGVKTLSLLDNVIDRSEIDLWKP